jgi:hypothetical protein
MSGSARAGTISREAYLRTVILNRCNARSHERAPEICAFLLTKTYVEVGKPEPIPPKLNAKQARRVGGHRLLLHGRSNARGGKDGRAKRSLRSAGSSSKVEG